jgi:hypothetical protein
LRAAAAFSASVRLVNAPENAFVATAARACKADTTARRLRDASLPLPPPPPPPPLVADSAASAAATNAASCLMSPSTLCSAD